MKIVNINQVPVNENLPTAQVRHIYPESLPIEHNGKLHPEISWVGTHKSQNLVSKETGTTGLSVRTLIFNKGARCIFHSHTSDQIAIAFAGIGIQATEEGETVVKVGDVVHFLPGEKHWHGATKESDFTQVVVTYGAGEGDRETYWYLED